MQGNIMRENRMRKKCYIFVLILLVVWLCQSFFFTPMVYSDPENTEVPERQLAPETTIEPRTTILPRNIVVPNSTPTPDTPEDANTSARDAGDADEGTPVLDVSATNIGGLNFGFSMYAQASVLVDADSGKVLAQKNKHVPYPVASIVKVMTMILVMEDVEAGVISLSDIVTVSANAASIGGSRVWLTQGETFTVEELLRTVAIRSANDSCVALAEHLAGTEEAFVQRMNQKAQEMGLANTVFVDSTGLNDRDQHSSAYDVAMMSRYLIFNHPEIKEYMGMVEYFFRDGTMEIRNTNHLLEHYEGMYGIKTGTTNRSGHCLVAGAIRGDMHLISVVLGCRRIPDTRFRDTRNILDFGFANFENVRLATAGDLVGERITLRKAVRPDAEVVHRDDFVDMMVRGRRENIRTQIVVFEDLEAPMQARDKVGEVKFLDGDGEVIAVQDLVLAYEVRRATWWELFKELWRQWLMP